MARAANRDSEETRKRILESFIDLAAQLGISSITLQDVAKESRLSFTTVRYHFNQKGLNLETEAADHVLRHGQQFTTQFVAEAHKKKDYDPLIAYIRASFAWTRKHRTFATYLLHFYYLSATQADLKVSNGEMIQLARQRVLTLLRESRGMNHHKKEASTALAAEVHAQVFGCVLLYMALGNKNMDPNPEDMCIDLIEKILRS